MEWDVQFDEAFAEEFVDFAVDVQDEIRTGVILLRRIGPQLGRPHADTLKASKHPNMKELRVKAADGVWRIAFAFDPARAAILLVAGDKSGVSEKRFYKQLIETADRRFTEHLSDLKRRGD